MDDMLREGAILATLGITVVFFVLIIIMGVINAISKFINKTEPVQESEVLKSAVLEEATADSPETVAILTTLQALEIIPSGGRIHIEEVQSSSK